MSENALNKYTVIYTHNKAQITETVALWGYEDETEANFIQEIADINDYHPDDIIILDWKRKN